MTLGYVRAITVLREQITVLEERIAKQLGSHPDGAIFTSLPRSGSVRAATLLAEIGDCRERFPTPEALACLAGAAPSTRQSGQHLAVTFRYACDKKLRDALIDFADDSRHANAWAADIYGGPGGVASAILMRCASSRGPGSTSSGAAGRTVCPTIRSDIKPSSGSPSPRRPESEG